jgi:hypothetical protein
MVKMMNAGVSDIGQFLQSLLKQSGTGGGGTGVSAPTYDPNSLLYSLKLPGGNLFSPSMQQPQQAQGGQGNTNLFGGLDLSKMLSSFGLGSMTLGGGGATPAAQTPTQPSTIGDNGISQFLSSLLKVGTQGFDPTKNVNWGAKDVQNMTPQTANSVGLGQGDIADAQLGQSMTGGVGGQSTQPGFLSGLLGNLAQSGGSLGALSGLLGGSGGSGGLLGLLGLL